MVNVLWGYDPSFSSFKIVKLGEKNELVAIKQIFAAILFRNSGVKGMAVNFHTLSENSSFVFQLSIDSAIITEREFTRADSKIVTLPLDNTVFPKRKVEAVLKSKQGEISLYSTPIGTGMGFIVKKIENNFYPSANFSIGILV